MGGGVVVRWSSARSEGAGEFCLETLDSMQLIGEDRSV